MPMTMPASPASVKDGTLIGFVNGMTTNEKDLADVMYEDVSLHDEHGDWQMIFGVDVAPSTSIAVAPVICSVA